MNVSLFGAIHPLSENPTLRSAFDQHLVEFEFPNDEEEDQFWKQRAKERVLLSMAPSKTRQMTKGPSAAAGFFGRDGDNAVMVRVMKMLMMTEEEPPNQWR
jgi:hypothetical protein